MAKIIHIPKTKTFDLPCGLYKCQLDQTKCMARQTQRGRQDWIRLIFTVDVPGMDNVLAYAGRNFVLDANVGSDLRNFLEQWLGEQFFAQRSNSEFDIDTLIGTEGVIELTHFYGDNNDRPYVNIAAVHPAGSIKTSEAKPKSVAPKITIK